MMTEVNVIKNKVVIKKHENIDFDVNLVNLAIT